VKIDVSFGAGIGEDIQRRICSRWAGKERLRVEGRSDDGTRPHHLPCEMLVDRYQRRDNESKPIRYFGLPPSDILRPFVLVSVLNYCS